MLLSSMHREYIRKDHRALHALQETAIAQSLALVNC